MLKQGLTLLKHAKTVHHKMWSQLGAMSMSKGLLSKSLSCALVFSKGLVSQSLSSKLMRERDGSQGS